MLFRSDDLKRYFQCYFSEFKRNHLGNMWEKGFIWDFDMEDIISENEFLSIKRRMVACQLTAKMPIFTQLDFKISVVANKSLKVELFNANRFEPNKRCLTDEAFISETTKIFDGIKGGVELLWIELIEDYKRIHQTYSPNIPLTASEKDMAFDSPLDRQFKVSDRKSVV